MIIKKSVLWWGVGITGLAGGLAGSFMGKWIYVMVLAGIGGILGFVIGLWGGQRFFLSIVIGAMIGGGLAAYWGGQAVSLLGAAFGGAIGGFLSVPLNLLSKRYS